MTAFSLALAIFITTFLFGYCLGWWERQKRDSQYPTYEDLEKELFHCVILLKYDAYRTQEAVISNLNRLLAKLVKKLED